MAGGEDNNNKDKPEKPKKSFKVAHAERMSRCSKFCWDSEHGTCCGRRPLSWLQILSFYLCFYACLAALWAICMAVYLATLDNIAPTQQGMYSMLKLNPGMGQWPTSASDATSIFFSTNNASTYNVTYVQSLNTTINSQWPNSSTDGLRTNCAFGGQVADYDAACFYNYTNDFINSNCTVDNNFGYDIGKPCVLLRINKIYGWNPAANLFDGTMGPKETEWSKISPNIKSQNATGYIPISCQGETDGDMDHIQNVTFFPPQGINTMYFPYMNQKPYMPPAAMAQFTVTPGVAILFWCKIWLKNIIHDRTDLQGSIHFELYIMNNVTAH